MSLQPNSIFGISNFDKTKMLKYQMSTTTRLQRYEDTNIEV